MNALVQARLNAETANVLDRYAAANSLNRSDALRVLILQSSERNNLYSRFEKLEKIIGELDAFSKVKDDPNIDKFALQKNLETIAKVMNILIENVFLPAAQMDRKPALREALQLLAKDI